jgi:hypothetical protein
MKSRVKKATKDDTVSSSSLVDWDHLTSNSEDEEEEEDVPLIRREMRLEKQNDFNARYDGLTDIYTSLRI